MTRNFRQDWDASADPPNWGHSFTPEKTISLEEYSEEEWESLYNEGEIEKEKDVRDQLQEVIDQLETNETNLKDPRIDVEQDNDDEEVFEVTITEPEMDPTVNKKKNAKTDSTGPNVFAANDSRPNSEEFFVSKSIAQRRLSMNPEMMRKTRSATKASLTRVPIAKTPLKSEKIRESDTSPGSP